MNFKGLEGYITNSVRWAPPEKRKQIDETQSSIITFFSILQTCTSRGTHVNTFFWVQFF